MQAQELHDGFKAMVTHKIKSPIPQNTALFYHLLSFYTFLLPTNQVMKWRLSLMTVQRSVLIDAHIHKDRKKLGASEVLETE